MSCLGPFKHAGGINFYNASSRGAREAANFYRFASFGWLHGK